VGSNPTATAIKLHVERAVTYASSCPALTMISTPHRGPIDCSASEEVSDAQYRLKTEGHRRKDGSPAP
jgi:hypothetical protein